MVAGTVLLSTSLTAFVLCTDSIAARTFRLARCRCRNSTRMEPSRQSVFSPGSLTGNPIRTILNTLQCAHEAEIRRPYRLGRACPANRARAASSDHKKPPSRERTGRKDYFGRQKATRFFLTIKRVMFSNCRVTLGSTRLSLVSLT